MNNNLLRLRLLLTTLLLRIRKVKLHSKARIYPGCELSSVSNITLHTNSVLYKNCTLHLGNKGSFTLGTSSHIAPYGYFLIDNNHLTIGSRVAVGPFCAFFCVTNTYPAEGGNFVESYANGDINIGSNVHIGAHCTLLPGTIIEDNVVIGANSVVKGVLHSGSVYAGSPAKRIKSIPGCEQE